MITGSSQVISDAILRMDGMGDTKSWLIFLAAALVALTFGTLCLIAAVTALVRTVSGRRRRSNAKLKRVDSEEERWRDNKLQAFAILGMVAIFSTIGIAISLHNQTMEMHWTGGAFLGSIAGLVIGLVVSGTMILLVRTRRTSK